jgi:hypothetical protein
VLQKSLRVLTVFLIGLLLLDVAADAAFCEDAPGSPECHACSCGTHIAPVVTTVQADAVVVVPDYLFYSPAVYAFLRSSSFFHPPRAAA